MNYLPRPDIPEPVLKALVHDSYVEELESYFGGLEEEVKGRYDYAISVTTLTRSPRQRILYSRHHHEITVDPVSKMWSILGRVGHSILEDYHEPGDETEVRRGILVPINVNGIAKIIYLHGCADIYSPSKKKISDYKFTKAGALQYDKSDHHAQLNLLKYIWRKCGLSVEETENVYLLRDWEAKYVRDGSDYPTEPIVVRPGPDWGSKACEEYIMQRLAAHFANEPKPSNELDFCTPAERWQSEPEFGVFKLDGDLPQKVAKHWATSRMEAEDEITRLMEEDWQKIEDWAASLKKKTPTQEDKEAKRSHYIIKEYPSIPRRCGLCDCAPFCNQRIQELLDQPQETKTEAP